MRRVRVAAADLLAFAVEREDVPGPWIVRVVALVRVAGGLTEVAKVHFGSLAVVDVVTWGRARYGSCSDPTMIVAVGERFGGSVLVCVVAEDRHCVPDVAE